MMESDAFPRALGKGTVRRKALKGLPSAPLLLYALFYT